MINPTVFSEVLLFTTVRLENSNGIGTGFIYGIRKDGNLGEPIIITSKHVMNNSNSCIFNLHFKNDDESPSDSFTTIDYFNIDVINHPQYDLCCFGFGGVIQQAIDKFKRNIYFKCLDENQIWSDDKLVGLKAVEDIVMYGYPNGLYDQKHMLPLIRKGITAYHPCLDFNGESVGVIDAACFPGSSGSPIFIMNENMVPEKDGNVSLARRLILLGVLYGGPTMTAEGELDIVNIPTSKNIISKTNIMMNIGYYVKAKEILKLAEMYKLKNA